MEDTFFVEHYTLEIEDKERKFVVLRIYAASVVENFRLRYFVG